MISLSTSFVALSLALSLARATPVMRMSKRQDDHTGVQTGDLTFYDTGMTSCGIVKSDSDLIAAVSKLYYDTVTGATANPNLNPLCGQKATVTNPATGKSVTVEIWDRCEGCAFGDIDLTHTAYNMIADPKDGRVGGITWQLGTGTPAPPATTAPPAPPVTTAAPITTPPPAPPVTTSVMIPTTTVAPPAETTPVPVPTSTEAPSGGPSVSTAIPEPTSTEDPCPPEETTAAPTSTEDPCPPEETTVVPTSTEDPCPPEETTTAPVSTEDPCPPEESSTAAPTATVPTTTAPVPTGNTSSGSVKAWDANTVYVGGNEACQDGKKYKASWWNQAEKPPGTSSVWVEDGTC